MGSARWVAVWASFGVMACGDDDHTLDATTTAATDAATSTSDATSTTAAPTDATGTTATDTTGTATVATDTTGDVASTGLRIVFVSRAINDRGSIYWDEPRDLPGVGAHSRVRPAAPGSLLVLEPDGAVTTLVDGANPTAASLDLIDVNGPAVSYDGARIVFAGLPAGDWPDDPARSVGGWRLYMIGADGRDLRKLPLPEATPSLAQFGAAASGLGGFDDYDPTFLPDGRIAFASTRWPSFGQYSGVRASNLYVVQADGQRLVRITAERNGADRPLVDPLTGAIVYARWWRNHRFPIDSLDAVPVDAGDPSRGWRQKDGLTTDRNDPVGGPSMFRNAWQAATIHPDGTHLAMWSGIFRNEEANHVYGGTFTPEGDLLANYFPMYNMTEASGFGGIRRYRRGASRYEPVAGVTTLTLEYVNEDPTSYGIFTGTYFTDPEALPDGRIVASRASDIGQDYGLVVRAAAGGEWQPLFDRPGTSELRARVLAARPLPPVLPDAYRDDPARPAPAALPPAGPPWDGDGTFTFEALNVYANGPVDSDIVSAIPVGSAGSIRFFADPQRTSPGSFPELDWPVLLGEAPIAPDGSVVDDTAPANIPLFEQIRGKAADGYRVPETGGPEGDGAAHVAGMNFGPPGAVARCVGCHAGHTLIPVPEDDAAARFSNLAPGAALAASSTRDARYLDALVDRRVARGPIWRTQWTSGADTGAGEWVELTFPVPVTVRAVRLWGVRQGDEANATIAVSGATVALYAAVDDTTPAATATSGAVAAGGTDVTFADMRARRVRVTIDAVTGTFYGIRSAGLGEVEVIARGEADAPVP